MKARLRTVLPAAMLAAVVLLFWQSGPSLYRTQLATLAGIWAVAAMGLGLLLGGAGQINLGQAGFVGAGAWVVGVATREQGWPFLVGVVIAVVVATVIGVIVGFATLRLEGHYLALATLAFGLLFNETMDTFLVSGIYGVPAPEVFGYRIGTAGSLMLTVWSVVILLYIGARSMLGSRFGRALAALRDDPLAASSCGVDLSRLRIEVFAISAALGGLAGALFAPYQTSVTDSSFGFFLSVNLLMMVVIGGLGSTMGPVIGSLFLVVVPEFGRSWERYRLFGYGVVLILVIVGLPRGLTGIADTVRRRLSRFSTAHPPGDRAQVAEALVAAERDEGPLPIAAEPLLAVENLSKRFGGLQAVDGVNLDLRRGEIHALIGPNGAGKTTFFNCISGVDHPDRGAVVVHGVDLTGSPAHVMARSGLMRTFQHTRPFRGLSVRDNVMVGAHTRSGAGMMSGTLRTPGARKEEHRLRMQAGALLDVVGLGSRAARLAGLLTLAEERRLELARCLAAEPSALLLDEPAAGLGDEEADELATLVVRLCREYGIGVILIEHHLDMALGIADRVTVLDFGRVIKHGTPAEVRGDRRVIEAYIGSKA